MNLLNRVVQIRYVAKLLSLNLGWLITSLAVQGVQLNHLYTQGSLVALLLVNCVFLRDIADALASKGDIDPIPPAALTARLSALETHVAALHTAAPPQLVTATAGGTVNEAVAAPPA